MTLEVLAAVATPEQLALMLGGAVGSFLRAWITRAQETWSRKTLVDVLLGGAIGLLWDTIMPIEFKAGTTLLQQATILGVLAATGNATWTSAAAKLGAKLGNGNGNSNGAGGPGDTPSSPAAKATAGLVLLAVLVTGCARVATIAKDDAVRAGEIAAAFGDPDGEACAAAVVEFVRSQPAPAKIAPVGAFSAFMFARELRRVRQGGIPSAVHRACAVVVLEAEETIIKLGLKVAPVPGLGALVPGR